MAGGNQIALTVPLRLAVGIHLNMGHADGNAHPVGIQIPLNQLDQAVHIIPGGLRACSHGAAELIDVVVFQQIDQFDLLRTDEVVIGKIEIAVLLQLAHIIIGHIIAEQLFIHKQFHSGQIPVDRRGGIGHTEANAAVGHLFKLLVQQLTGGVLIEGGKILFGDGGNTAVSEAEAVLLEVIPGRHGLDPDGLGIAALVHGVGGILVGIGEPVPLGLVGSSVHIAAVHGPVSKLVIVRYFIQAGLRLDLVDPILIPAGVQINVVVLHRQGHFVAVVIQLLQPGAGVDAVPDGAVEDDHIFLLPVVVFQFQGVAAHGAAAIVAIQAGDHPVILQIQHNTVGLVASGAHPAFVAELHQSLLDAVAVHIGQNRPHTQILFGRHTVHDFRVSAAQQIFLVLFSGSQLPADGQSLQGHHGKNHAQGQNPHDPLLFHIQSLLYWIKSLYRTFPAKAILFFPTKPTHTPATAAAEYASNFSLSGCFDSGCRAGS